MSRTGVFLDRDDTLIRDRIYLSDPDGIEILPGVPQALRVLNERGIPVIVATNQSGIARGFLDEELLAAIHVRLLDLLLRQGARIDAIYHCPHHPEGTVNEYTRTCSCRKPQPGMLLEAARDFCLDLSKCYMIGDKPEDIETIHRVGGTGILVRTGTMDVQNHSADFTARDLSEAVVWILENMTP